MHERTARCGHTYNAPAAQGPTRVWCDDCRSTASACGHPVARRRDYKRPRYCSSCASRVVYEGTLRRRECATCGCSYEGGNMSKYCSARCKYAANRARNKDRVNAALRAETIRRRLELTRPCRRCSRPIPPTRSMSAKFCSAECSRLAYPKDSPNKVCDESDCDRPVRARKMCSMHYRRWARATGVEQAPPWNARRRANHERRLALKRGASRTEAFDRQDIFIRDNWTCGICGAPVDQALEWPNPRSASIDHIIPLSLGGDHSPQNAQCAHLECNLQKGNRLAA